MLTAERKQAIIDYLGMNEDYSVELLNMNVDEAARKMNSDGCDFKAEELKEFADMAENIGNGSEIDAEMLNDVVGGCGSMASWIYRSAFKRWRSGGGHNF